jgi:hypothetical protein
MAFLVNDNRSSTINNSFVTRMNIYNSFPTNEDEREFLRFLEMQNLVHIPGVLDSSVNSMVGDGIIHYFGQGDYAQRLFGTNLTNIVANLTGFDFFGQERFTVLRILDIESARQSVTFRQKEVLVVPALRDTFDGDTREPLIGYFFDNTNQVVDSVQFQDMDDLEDQTRFWVWVVDYEPLADVPTNSGTEYWDCTGLNAPVQNDGLWDIFCGEDSINSPMDCRGPSKRKLKINWIDLLGDRKNKEGYGYGYDYMETYIQGAYELGFVVLIKKSIYKVASRGGLIDHKFHNVKRKRYKNGNFKKANNGVVGRLWSPSVWARVDPWDDYTVYRPNLAGNGVPIKDNVLDAIFNPMRDTIYILWYEHDNGNNKKRRALHDLDVGGTYFSTFTGILSGDKQNGRAAGPKKPSLNLIEPNSSGEFHHYIRILPTDWSSNGMPAMTGTFDLVRPTNHGSTTEYFVSFGLKFE